MTRLCYLVCDGCQFEYQKGGCGFSEDGRGYERAEDLLRDAVASGWAVNRIDDKDVCPECRARPVPDFWESKRPVPPAGPAATDLTWD